MFKPQLLFCVGLFSITALEGAAAQADQPAATVAAPTIPPTPIAAVKPPPLAPNLIFGGRLRSYYFVRQNAQQNPANPNRTAFLPGGTLHAEYRFHDTPFRVGASYTGADPLGTNGPRPQLNSKVDNTLPGFALSTLNEAYVSYRSRGLKIMLGDRVLNYPWYPSSDSRMKPESYEGLDVDAAISPNVRLGVTRVTRFEQRASSRFTANTLLTSRSAGFLPPLVVRDTAGALRTALVLKSARFTANLENDQFYDLANLSYAAVTYAIAPRSAVAPYVSLQYVDEHESGRAYLGRIANNTIGFQISANASKNVSLTFGFDTAPAHYAIVRAASAAAATAGYFVPTGGTTTTALVSKGIYRVAYGGIASPYTYSASDPLYTSTVTDGMSFRRSTGNAYKLAVRYVTPDRRFRAIASEAYHQYDNALGRNRTFIDVFDLEYFFNSVRKGPYKGLSLRQRFVNRAQPTLPDEFKYIRTQLEYDF